MEATVQTPAVSPPVERSLLIATVVGTPRPASPAHVLARAVAERIGTRIRSRTGRTVELESIDLAATAAASVGAIPTIPSEDVESVQRADVVVFASPIRRGAYTWLLKLFAEALPPRALQGKIAIPVMVAPAPRHALTADMHLRPLLLELGASCPTPALFTLEQRISDCQSLVADWLDRSWPALPPYA
jgi:FMN reductase